MTFKYSTGASLIETYWKQKLFNIGAVLILAMLDVRRPSGAGLVKVSISGRAGPDYMQALGQQVRLFPEWQRGSRERVGVSPEQFGFQMTRQLFAVFVVMLNQWPPSPRGLGGAGETGWGTATRAMAAHIQG